MDPTEGRHLPVSIALLGDKFGSKEGVDEGGFAETRFACDGT